MMKPGKGLRADLSEGTIEFINDSIVEVGEALDIFFHDDTCTDITVELESIYGWDREEDSYGKKAYASHGDDVHEIRVTVIETFKGDLKLDIREWYEEES